MPGFDIPLAPIGMLHVGDMNALFPRQLQPPSKVTDFMGAKGTSSYGADGLRFDAHAFCCYAEPVFVPHNNRFFGTPQTHTADLDSYLVGGFPDAYWIGGTITPDAHLQLQAFASRPYGTQVLDEVCTDPAQVASTKFSVALAADDGDAPDPMRGFQLRYMQQRYLPGAGGGTTCYVTFSVGDPDGDPDAWSQYRVWLDNTGPRIMRSYPGSGDGAFLPIAEGDWTTVKLPHDTAGAAVGAGSVYHEPVSVNGRIEVLVVNSTISISLNGGAPCLTPVLGDVGSVQRVCGVSLDASAFSALGWHIHPTKFRAEGSFTSTPLQLGYVPGCPEGFPSGVRGATAGALAPYYYVFTPEQTVQVDSGGSAPVTPDTSTVAVVTVDPTVAAPQYTLTIDNVESDTSPFNPQVGAAQGDAAPPDCPDVAYSDDTAVVCRVMLCVDEIALDPTPGAGTAIPIYQQARIGPPIKTIEESYQFDVASMTIRHGASVTVDNWHGIDNTAAYYGINGSGNIGVSFELGYQHTQGIALGQFPTFGGAFPRFTGMCTRYEYARPAANRALMTMTCKDHMYQLDSVLVAAPPNFDGENHYWVMAWLAAKAGISWKQLHPSFQACVPEDPFGPPTTADPDYATGGYYLPLGEGLNPWTPVNRTQSVLTIMDAIRKLSGYLLYFDSRGLLRYERWVPTLDGTPKRVFTEQSSIDDMGGPTDIHFLSGSIDTSDVRNEVVVLGVDPYNADDPFGSVFKKRTDSASIYSPPNHQPTNYVGFPRAFMWFDPRFAVQSFANDAANRLIRWLRIPTQEVQLACWYQPDLYPLDFIGVADPKSNAIVATVDSTLPSVGMWSPTMGVSIVPFMITGMTQRMSVEGNRVVEQSCTLQARYIDPSVFGTAVYGS